MSGFTIPDVITPSEIDALFGGPLLQVAALNLTEKVKSCRKSS
jgi:hypothetical protein